MHAHLGIAHTTPLNGDPMLKEQTDADSQQSLDAVIQRATY